MIEHEPPSPAQFPRDQQTPLTSKVVLAGIVIALITFLAGVIGFLSTRQAPPQPPVVEQN